MADPQTTSTAAEVKNVYVVVVLPPDGVTPRLKKLMQGLRAEFDSPQFKPHITVVGPISLTLEDALTKFRLASEGFKAYDAKVDHVATDTFFYQCVPPHKSDPSAYIASLSFPVTRLALHNINGDHEEKIAECTLESN